MLTEWTVYDTCEIGPFAWILTGTDHFTPPQVTEVADNEFEAEAGSEVRTFRTKRAAMHWAEETAAQTWG